MKPRAVIFDRDGVLTYFDVKKAQSFLQPLLPISLWELSERWQAWGAQVGFPASQEQEDAFWGGFWRQLHKDLALSDAQYQALARCNYTDFMGCFPEVIDTLRQLSKQGVAVGVLSNFSLASLATSLEAVGIAPYVDVACAATVIGYAKPHPQAYLHIADLLHLPPAACLFFDDEEPCVAGAAAVGMHAYRVDRRAKHDDPHTRTVHTLRAVLDLFNQQPTQEGTDA